MVAGIGFSIISKVTYNMQIIIWISIFASIFIYNDSICKWTSSFLNIILADKSDECEWKWLIKIDR